MTDYTLLLEKIRNLGMSHNWAITFVNRLKEDEEYFTVSEEDRKWAMERGFFPGRVELYGLNEDNWRDFLPDFQYSMMHPLNNHFLKWLDKLTLKYVLNSNGCECLMPDYYAYVENELCGGRYTYLMDCPDDIPKDKDFLWNLLKKFKVLALKPNSGTAGGLGFIKLELRGDGIYENNKPIDMARVEEIRDTMRNYIITEYSSQHHELAGIWEDSECTLRVIMCKKPNPDKFAPYSWECIVSLARFGTKDSGTTSNLSAGGIGVAFDFEDGRLYGKGLQYRPFAKGNTVLSDRHPDTGVRFEGFMLPNWQYVKEKIVHLCQHIGSLDYMGLDIIITENGMKLCEINTLPSIDYNQIICGPALRNDKVRNFFLHKGMDSINSKEFYNAYTECQTG
ncbi:MAG: sugar-transfer associated ATP-grasp domain-containing protein [Lachnospiraceae bacterium]|nr:sugar-transfer associated ATP-grasp domain-containing protein [Lachnospiraceae bacterium]